MRTSRALAAIGVPALLGLAAFVYVGCGIGLCSPGGVGPGYHAVDHDLYLTYVARSSKPLIAAVAAYHAAHGAYPATLADAGASSPERWTYSPADDGFALRLRLGWDPSLVYAQRGSLSGWIFEPGDGSDATEIKLTP